MGRVISMSNYSHGTTVAVHDLFGNLPVRVKDRTLRAQDKTVQLKEFGALRRRVLAIALACGRLVTISVANNEQPEETNFKFRLGPIDEQNGRPSDSVMRCFDASRVKSLFRQCYRLTTEDDSRWATVSGRTMRFSARAVICLGPVPTKHLQFMSFGTLALDSQAHQGMLFEEVNRIFSRSTFGMWDEESELGDAKLARRARDKRSKANGQSRNRTRDQLRGPDRHPMFYIRVESASDDGTSVKPSDHANITRSQRAVEDILELLRPMIWQCLDQHGYQPYKLRRKRRHKAVVQQLGQEQAPNLEARWSYTRQSSVEPSVFHSLGVDSSINTQNPSRTFADWTRIKSSSKDCLKELGLAHRPRSAFEGAISQPEFDNPKGNIFSDSSVTLASGDENDLSESGTQIQPANLPHTESTENVSLANATPDRLILWKDPSSGKPVHLNSRTGLVIPDLDRPNSGATSGATITQLPIARRQSTRLPLANGAPMPPTPDDFWLKDWKNPVFKAPEDPIPSISLDVDEIFLGHGKAFKSQQLSFNESSAFSRLTRAALATASVIGQVDSKFILISMATDASSEAGKQLVLVDQHAADERCRVEQLLQELCDPKATEVIGPPGLSKPLGFEVSREEARMLERDRDSFALWGFGYEIKRKRADSRGNSSGGGGSRGGVSRPSSATSRSEKNELLLIKRLPSVIAERCRLEPRVLIEMLRTEIWARNDSNSISSSSKVRQSTGCSHELPTTDESSYTLSSSDRDAGQGTEWVSRLPSIPRTLLNLLNSRACRSAVMFNDKLTQEECVALVRRLARCKFPFLCAHGRRSVAVVGKVGATGFRSDGGEEEECLGKGEDFGAWMDTI